MSGNVIPLPLVRRTCFQCVHHRWVGLSDDAESWCVEFDEPIDSEIFAAKDCSEYCRR